MNQDGIVKQPVGRQEKRNRGMGTRGVKKNINNKITKSSANISIIMCNIKDVNIIKIQKLYKQILKT